MFTPAWPSAGPTGGAREEGLLSACLTHLFAGYCRLYCIKCRALSAMKMGKMAQCRFQKKAVLTGGHALRRFKQAV